MKVKKVFERSMYYFEKGYSFTATPFAFLGYASSIYYLAIQNIPFLKDSFPRFSDFLFLAVLTLPLLCGLVGYFYMKRSWLFKAEQEINMESNPYAYKLTVGINTVLNKYQVIGAEMNLLWWKKLGLSTPEIEQKYDEYVRLLKHLGSGGDLRTFLEEKSK